jgi:uncharacterized protein GlcG (DUF336 family)
VTTKKNRESNSPIVDKKALTLAGARHVLLAAEAEAKRQGLSVAIAIVDDGGHLLHFIRMDNLHIAPIDVSLGKARTALRFKKPSKVFADALASGSQGLLALADLVPLEGGVPLNVGGATVGAIGVSGGPPDIDGKIAMAGAAALTEVLG